MKKGFLLFICITIFTLNSFSQKASKNCYHNINSDDFNLLIETKEFILIDVRLNKEYRKERLHNARLGASSETLVQILKNIDKNIFVLVYCDEGDRSETATQIICTDLGFKNVYNLMGGIQQWKTKGYPIDRSRITVKRN